MMYIADANRYKTMEYKRCGRSGLLLPRMALGLWHNFGSVDSFENAKTMLFKAFDLGITHFDLANNYGPVYGSAEETFGRVISGELRPYRDELIISTKAGYDMWPGPYGNFGSRKYLMASLDQSLNRMKLDYVDIFYHHRPDPDTPLEETMNALSDIVRQGKALYVGISNYNSEQTRAAAKILAENKTPLLIHQPRYNILDRHVEADDLFSVLDEVGAGSICFSPLAQGILTDRYLHGIPSDSRATRNHFLRSDSITAETVARSERLAAIAAGRGQSLAQMALAWVLRNATTVLIGASRPQQIEDNVAALKNLDFSEEELQAIDTAIG
ncbi:MAG: aldo/keto reductase [Oscillospiraceae bacterium]|nr:aldo/keto reductase [Oscillospiraceae bacterium]